MTGHATDANRTGATPVTARLAVLSGPSGAGKGAVVQAIRQHFPGVWLSVSVTTRAPRRGETHGIEYLFVSDPEFDKMVADGDLLEWAEFAGKRYGTPRAPVMAKLSAGVPALLGIEPSGARQIRRAVPGALLVFLAPSSPRRPAAGPELQAAAESDVMLVNTSLPDVCSQLVALVTAHASSRHGLGRYMPVRAEAAPAGQACPGSSRPA